MDDYKKQFALNLIAYAVQRDVSAIELCNAAFLDPKILRGSSNIAISDKQMNDLWLSAIRFTHDPLFGLHFGESVQLAALGVVGQIIQASKTVGDALNIAAQSISMITDMVSIQVTQERKVTTIQFNRTGNSDKDAQLIQQVIDFFMVFTIHEMDGLVLEKITPKKVSLPLKNITNVKEYERIFRCKPRDADRYSIDFDSRIANIEIITANHDLQRHLLSMSSNSKPIERKVMLSERVVNYLTANAYLGIASLEDIASNFNMGARTLQRKLNEEGMSFQQLSDSVRKSVALHYLESRKYPVKEISHILGYNELSAFTRAFKRWTGKTPMDYQKA